MRINKILYSLFTVGFFTLSNSINAMDLHTFVTDSISKHPSVREKIHTYRQVFNDAAIANSGWRPSIDVDASTGLYKTDSPQTGGQSIDYDSTQVELSLTQNLFNGYDTTYQQTQTKERVNAALYEVYDTADNLALDAIQAYLNALKQLKLSALAKKNVDEHETILSQIRVRFESGVGRRSQLQQTEGRVARAHTSMIAQQNNLYDAATQLHAILGRYVDPATLDEPAMPELSAKTLDELIDQALQSHPAIRVASHNILASEADYKRSNNHKYPTIDLRLAQEYGTDIGGVSGDTDELSLVLLLKYNIYDGHASTAETQKKISIVNEDKEFRSRVQRQVINTLRLAWIADASLTRQSEFVAKHVQKSGATLESYQEEFFIGQRDLLDVLDAENEYNQAQNLQAETHYDALAARYRIYEGLGELFDNMGIVAKVDHDDLTLVRTQLKQSDKLPLDTDEDADNELDLKDHCDNTVAHDLINIYGCRDTYTLNFDYEKPNSLPVALDDEFEMDENGVLFITQNMLLENDKAADQGTLSVIRFSMPKHGQLAFNQDKNLIYRPQEGYIGTDSFVYTVSAGDDGSTSATVHLKVKKSTGIELSKVQYVNFIYDEDVLTKPSERSVLEIIAKIKTLDISKINIQVFTYTDSIGSFGYNERLSNRRAKAMYELLQSYGIDRSSIEAVGKGELNPIADNATDSGRAINRRGEFRFSVKTK